MKIQLYFFCHFIQVYNGLENKCTMWRMTFLLSCIFNCSQLDFFFYYNKCGHRNVLSKRQVWMSIFHIINFKKKKKTWTQGSWIFFNKKVIMDYYFCLKSGPVFLFQIFIIAPLPLPRDIKLYH